MTKQILLHHGYDESKASEATRRIRQSDVRTRYQAATTQVWSWEGGDAIIIFAPEAAVGYLGYAVIRVQDDVQVIECDGLKAALRWFNINLSDYTITTEAELAA